MITKKDVEDWFYKKHPNCKDVDCMMEFRPKYVLEDIFNCIDELVNNSDIIGGVSDLFVLSSVEGFEATHYWSGKRWQIDKNGCPTYSWDKAQEYSMLMNCEFTDSK